MHRFFLITLLIPLILLGRQKNSVIHPGVAVPYEPWFTGTLLAPTPVNMKPGHPAIEPIIKLINTLMPQLQLGNESIHN